MTDPEGGRPLVWGRGGTGEPEVRALYGHLVAELRARDLTEPERPGSPTWLMASDEAAFERARGRIAPGHAAPDIVIATSGSTDGRGHLVALSLDALIASARATLERLGGPGLWVTSLPLHGVAGFQVVADGVTVAGGRRDRGGVEGAGGIGHGGRLAAKPG